MNFKRIFSAIAAFSLVFAIILCGCGNGIQAETASTEPVSEEPGEVGYKYHFTLEIIDGDGNQKLTDFSSDEENLGSVLKRLGIIKGEQGEFGLYIKEVDGIVADYETTGTYWALYIDGEMSMTGIDQVKIQNGSTYTLKVEK